MLDISKKQALIVKADKELVDFLLTLNSNNRHVKQMHLKWIQSALDEGNFVLTGQGISVSSTGRLIDGQHRLMAIRAAGYPPVELLVVTGLDNKARVYVDQHAKRSTTDMLKIVLNQAVTSRMSAVINMHLRVRENSEGDIIMPRDTKPSLDDFVNEMADHAYWLELLMSAAGESPRSGILCGLLHYALRYDVDAAIELADKARLGERLTRDEPAYLLRNFVMVGKRKDSRTAASQLEDYKHTISAAVAHSLGRRMAQLRPSTNWKGLATPKARPTVKTADQIKSKASDDIGKRTAA